MHVKTKGTIWNQTTINKYKNKLGHALHITQWKCPACSCKWFSEGVFFLTMPKVVVTVWHIKAYL